MTWEDYDQVAGWPAEGTRVHQDSTILFDAPKWRAERDKQEARTKRYKQNHRDRYLAYQRYYNEHIRPAKRAGRAA